MKLVVFCLFAVCCALANASQSSSDRISERRKLQEVLRQLKDVKQSLQQNEKMLNTPPQNIEDCCCLSALQCFRANLQVQFNVTEKKQKKLYASLNHPFTKRGLNFCNTGNATSNCQDCASHPKETATEFFNRLESLIQRALSRLGLN